jgi:hypothetical protein
VGPVAEFGFRQPPAKQLAAALAWERAEPTRRRLLVQRSQALDCIHFEPGPDAQRVGTANRRDWWLVSAAAARDCPIN